MPDTIHTDTTPKPGEQHTSLPAETDDTVHAGTKNIVSNGNDTLVLRREMPNNIYIDTIVGHSEGINVVDSTFSVTTETLDVKHEFGYEGKPLPHSYKAEEGITSLFLVSFILFTSGCNRGLEFIRQMVRNLFEATERESIFVDTTTVGDFKVRAFLLIQATILSAVFLFIVCSINNPEIIYTGEDVLIRISLFAGLLFLFWCIKWMINILLGMIFFNTKKALMWQTGYFSIIELFGIILFPVLLFMINVQSVFLLKGGIYFIFLMIAVGFILIINKGFSVFLKNTYGIFYLMLYLCTLEIIPYMGLYAGLNCIYKTVELSALWPLR